MDILTTLAASLQAGDDEQVPILARQALDAGLPPREVLQQGLIAGMNTVGELFREHEIFLPDVLMAAKAMHAGLGVLKPLLVAGDLPAVGKVVVGTVRGDMHDIGKNLVGILLQGAGFTVIDLGHDVAADTFIDAAEREQADVIGMSALLTTTMPEMRTVIVRLRERGLAGKVKTIVGGAPVTAAFASEIGADAYAFDAANAVDRLRALVGG